MTWTSSEVRYLEEHAGDGAAAIAEALGKSVTAIEVQAHRYGLSLRKRWLCPKCGRETFKPLSNRTGWCVSCTREQRATEIAEQVRAMEGGRTRRTRSASGSTAANIAQKSKSTITF